MASLLPTTAMCSCGTLVRVMLVLCSAQLTGPPAVWVLAELGSGSTLMEGWFPFWLMATHTTETEALHWFVWTEGPTRVCQWCTLESIAVKYQTKMMWCRHCVWEHILQRVLVSVYFPYCECMCIKSCIEKVVSLGDEMRTWLLCSVQRLIQRRGGGWIGWLAIIYTSFLFEHSLIYLNKTILVNKACDEMQTQILRQGIHLEQDSQTA